MAGASSAGSPRSTVVLVEDDEEIRDLIQLLFDLDGHFEVVGTSGNGRAGIDTVRLLRPSAVVLDLLLPNVSGVEAIGAMRRHSPESRIVVFSAYPDPLTLLDVLGQGADSYLDKATAWAEVVPVVAELCGLEGPAAR